MKYYILFWVHVIKYDEKFLMYTYEMEKKKGLFASLAVETEVSIHLLAFHMLFAPSGSVLGLNYLY